MKKRSIPVAAEDMLPYVGWIIVVDLLLFLGKVFFKFPDAIFTLVLGVSLFCFIVLCVFFRDPYRKIDVSSSDIVAPADGTVLKIEDTVEDEFIKGKAKKICIFLSLFNVHIQRVPFKGRIEFIRYVKGKFFPAWEQNAGIKNTRVEIGLSSKDTRIFIKQIAGIAARRINVWAKEGQDVNSGEKWGIIKFGSRVEIFLPYSADIKVKKGSKIKGGLTVIASLGDLT